MLNICDKQSVVLVTYAVMVNAGKYDGDDDDELTLSEGESVYPFSSLYFRPLPVTFYSL